MFLTIFTSTYNRSFLLGKLYESLCKQINNNFLWLIIDDGSEDETREFVKKWSRDKIISIRYKYQKNSGKHVAHNMACQLCNTELFLCVDSDDILSENAVKVIWDIWKEENDSNIAGFCARKGDMKGDPTGKRWPEKIKYSTFYDLYNKYKFKGELLLVWKREFIKKHKFPVFENEKFATENILYYQISYEIPMRLFNEIIYLFKYREDGYTSRGG